MTIDVMLVTRERAITFTNVPAKFEERDYNPCFDTVLVPDTEHVDFPSTLRYLPLSFVGPMAMGTKVVDGIEYKAMGRYESVEAYEMYSK